ncbi:caspase 8-like protein, partial [Dinothrombium tinctorium]
MSSKPRGLCIIIANVNFINDRMPRAELDTNNLKCAFEWLGFDVHLHQDLTIQAMFNLLDDYATKNEELDKHDSLAV